MSDSPILSAAIDELQKIKKLADKSIEQLSDEQLHATIDPEANSVAVLMRHMAGNMRSRWVNFLTSDGEKPDRMRDREFEDPGQSRAELIAEWEHGWQCVFDALTPLTDADLQRTVMIRGEAHSVYKAISRQVAHYAGPRLSDPVARQAPAGRELEDAVDPARPVRGVQPPHAREAEGRRPDGQ